MKPQRFVVYGGPRVKVNVIIFKTLKEMRAWRPKGFVKQNMSNALGICWHGPRINPTICLTIKNLGGGTIQHEAVHAALSIMRNRHHDIGWDPQFDDEDTSDEEPSLFEEILAGLVGRIANDIDAHLLAAKEVTQRVRIGRRTFVVHKV
jgi:hypothetical protein